LGDWIAGVLSRGFGRETASNGAGFGSGESSVSLAVAVAAPPGGALGEGLASTTGTVAAT
jgi:hypothetical protein